MSAQNGPRPAQANASFPKRWIVFGVAKLVAVVVAVLAVLYFNGLL